MTLHTESLSDSQRLIIPVLGKLASGQNFYLAGGTAVALYIGHRRSVDCDWFSRRRFDDPLVLAERLREQDLCLDNVSVAPGTLHSVIRGVQVRFFDYPYAEIAPATAWSDAHTEIASLDDLACMKLAALAQRGSRKDFVDLYAIASTHKPIHQIIALYRKKYSVTDIGHVLVGLTYFDDAEEEVGPIMLQDIKWEAVKLQFLEWARILSAQGVETDL